MSDQRALADHELLAVERATLQARQPLKRSAGFLIGGILLTGLGMVVSEAGRQQQITDALRGALRSSGGAMAGWGGIITVLGVIVVLVGVNRLATSVDRTAAAADAVLALTLRPAPAPEVVYGDEPDPVDT